MITRPLELQSRLSPAPRDLDFFAWVNVGVVALFFALLGSKFVLAPGVPVDVASSDGFVLPELASATQGAGPVSVVVSYRRDNVILFEGGMYALPELRKHLEAYIREHPHAVMLARVDRQVSVQGFLDFCELARTVGFARVLVAAERPSAEPGTN